MRRYLAITVCAVVLFYPALSPAQTPTPTPSPTPTGATVSGYVYYYGWQYGTVNHDLTILFDGVAGTLDDDWKEAVTGEELDFWYPYSKVLVNGEYDVFSSWDTNDDDVAWTACDPEGVCGGNSVTVSGADITGVDIELFDVCTPTPTVTPSWENAFNLLPQDSDGWSVPLPSGDSRIVYVSSADGDDGQAAIYAATDPEIGGDPQMPAGPISAFETITAAMNQVRDDFPDWVLLKRGDTWTRDTQINLKSGRSPSERFIITYYGDHPSRPFIRTGMARGVVFWKDVRYAAVLGLEFYAHKRDPNSPDFVGFDNVSPVYGFWSYADDPLQPNATIQIEDCRFSYFSNNVVQGPYRNTDIVLRRNIIEFNYSTTSHSQGMYARETSAFLEENLFDHNGWYQHRYGELNDMSEGQATYFNHNTYFTKTENTVFRGNIFARASSIGNKFTANSPDSGDVITARNVLVSNNLYIEGEIGISMGGNTDIGTGFRWENMQILNNVLLDIGRDRPTGRALGWYIDADDWKGGSISGNYLLHERSPDVTFVFGINFGEHSEDVNIDSNVFYGLTGESDWTFRIRGDEPKALIRIAGNRFALQGTDMQLIRTDYIAPGTFMNNIYYTDRDAGSWLQVQGSNVSFDTWAVLTGDTGSRARKLTFPDPDRTVETYHASLGKPATLISFLEEAKKQSKFNWRPEYTASRVNAYIRAGFGPTAVNFQPAAAIPVPGYLTDWGQGNADQGQMEYGWQ